MQKKAAVPNLFFPEGFGNAKEEKLANGTYRVLDGTILLGLELVVRLAARLNELGGQIAPKIVC
ncbi:hypothetical protein [Paenibacillus spongiae]|uniref:Uncharacterized protein n=1 Tax=Paenibacillus spongiae TaxID=2909671 RepID=A0ABY5S541_9BACL|nr:hypothetical protein [Paenibacillus spongiae]UVI29016.1 hypothetical protein L1F29_26790 [Paenibacillus spongiae]